MKTLFNFDPPATDDEVSASALQYVRKLSGSTKPSKVNEAAFELAVAEVTAASRKLLDTLVTSAPPKNREVEAAKRRARSAVRFGQNPATWMEFREEEPGDEPGVRSVNIAAFPTEAEANLVDALREHVRPLISLVAEDTDIVGHILFTPVAVEGIDGLAMGLAPMAVLPARQNGGIGSQLVTAGIERCRDIGAVAVVVLGHPEYYPRFGFEPASRFGLNSEYPVPDEVFMAQELVPGSLGDATLTVRYDPIFSQADVWNMAQDDQKIDYVELCAADFDAVQAFYEKAFGWSFTDYGPEYRAFNDGKLDGGFRKDDRASRTADGGALVILYANDLEAARQRVVDSGGKILEDIFSFPGGRRFQFADPHGNELAVWSDQ